MNIHPQMTVLNAAEFTSMLWHSSLLTLFIDKTEHLRANSIKMSDHNMKPKNIFIIRKVNEM